jgi:hypothetical protein
LENSFLCLDALAIHGNMDRVSKIIVRVEEKRVGMRGKD